MTRFSEPDGGNLKTAPRGNHLCFRFCRLRQGVLLIAVHSTRLASSRLSKVLSSKGLLSLTLASLSLAAWGSAEAATTYYVRADGGDASQCTGRADAAYPGSGTGKACAWKNPNIALPASGTRRIAGGDTLLIGGGTYQIGTNMQSVPSGPTASARTRIVGKAGAKLVGTNGISSVLSLKG